MSVMTIKLSKPEGASWGFRLQGGKDFATPLCIQKVNGGSVAATAGLQAGDAIVSINGKDALSLRHKEAQEAIVKAGNHFDLVVQRGAPTWKPAVTPLAQVKTTPEGVPVATSTSLAANKKYVAPVGSSHNTVALPFAEVNGQQIVNTQYNTPLKLYSDDNIAETLYAQAEVLGKGCLGVNFKKNERAYDGKTSDVLRMVQEMDKSPAQENEGEVSSLLSPDKNVVQGYSFKLLQQALQTDEDFDSPLSGGGPGPIGTRSVCAPQTKVKPEGAPSPLQSTKCSECERPIIGVFVRIKNKNLHADCFKCSTCGSSLKNVGYYNINEKLYCDVHAKQAARHNPPGPNLEPVLVKPGAPVPAGVTIASLAKVAPAPAPFKPPAGGVRIIPTSVLAPAPVPKFAPVPPPKSEPVAPEPTSVPAPQPEPEPESAVEPESELQPEVDPSPLFALSSPS